MCVRKAHRPCSLGKGMRVWLSLSTQAGQRSSSASIPHLEKIRLSFQFLYHYNQLYLNCEGHVYDVSGSGKELSCCQSYTPNSCTLRRCPTKHLRPVLGPHKNTPHLSPPWQPEQT